ncbi:uncharacterized protein LOC126378255 isoform X2 [Pectinophora gossypiella]|nr:uncharacterized protein LOC126378255 isoform X2 [Pectinophora gossypiella]
MQDNYDYMEGSDSSEVTLAPLNVDYAQPSRRRERSRRPTRPRPHQDRDSDLIPEPEEFDHRSEFAPKEIYPRGPAQQHAPLSPRQSGSHGGDDDDRVEDAGGHSSAERPHRARRPSPDRDPPVQQRDLFYYADDTHFADTNVVDPTFVNTFDGRNSRHKDRKHRDIKPHNQRDYRRMEHGPEDNHIDHDNDHQEDHGDHDDHGVQAVQGQDHANSVEQHTGLIDYGDEYHRTSPRYKILEVPGKSRSGRRSGAGDDTRRFLQEERADGVSILKLGDGPFPEFRLPPDRRQYMAVADGPAERRHRAPVPTVSEHDSSDDDPLLPGGLHPDTPLVPPDMPDITPELQLPPLPPGMLTNDAQTSGEPLVDPDAPLDTRRLADLLGDDLLNMV